MKQAWTWAAATMAAQVLQSAHAQADTPWLPATTVSDKRGSASPLIEPSTAGSRLDLSPLETPASVAVVPGALVRELGVTSVLEAKTLAPGITSSNNVGSGGNVLNARGFSGQNSVKQLYNGLEIYNAGGVVSFPFDPWNIERIEILSGPASVLYGTGAVGGAVNVVTKQPQLGPIRNEVALGVGSFGARHQALGSTGSLSEKVSYRLDVSHRSAANWIDRGESESTAVSGALRWDVTNALRFTLRSDYGEQKPMHYLGTPVFNNAPVPGTERRNYNIADSDLYFQDHWVTLETQWQPAADWSVQNTTYKLHHSRRYRDTFTFTYQPATGTVLRTNYRDIRRAVQSQEGSNTFAKYKGTLAGQPNEVLVGLQFNRSYYDRYDNIRGGRSVVNALAPVPGLYRDAYLGESMPVYFLTLHQLGLYAENRLALGDRWSVVAGLRSDRYETLNENRVKLGSTESKVSGTSGNLGVVFNPRPDVALYGQVARASDPVTSLASIGANQQGFGLSDGRQVEVGFKQSLMDGRLDWTVAAYRIVKKGLLTANLANPSLQEQVGQQSSRGVEASVRSRLGPLRLEANGTVLQARFDDFQATVGSSVVQLAGKVPVNVPQRAANVLTFWDFLPGWTARGVVQYVGKRFTTNTNSDFLPGYSTLDLGLAWQAAPGVLLDLRLENATNKTYATQGSSTQWLLGRPRAVWLAGRYAF